MTPGRHRWRFSSVSVLNSYFSFALLRGFYLHLNCSILYFPPQSSENLPHFTSHGFLPPVRLTRASPILNVKVTLRGTQSLSYKATASPLNSTFIGLRVFFFFSPRCAAACRAGKPNHSDKSKPTGRDVQQGSRCEEEKKERKRNVAAA